MAEDSKHQLRLCAASKLWSDVRNPTEDLTLTVSTGSCRNKMALGHVESFVWMSWMSDMARYRPD